MFDPDDYPVLLRFLYHIASRVCLPEEPDHEECVLSPHCETAP